MAINKTTSFTDGTSSDAVQSFFNTRLLMRGVYDHHAMTMVEKKTLAQRTGKTMIFRKYPALARATTALTEAVTPSSTAKTKTDIAATIAAYGAYIENSDFLGLSQPEGLMEDVDLLAQQLGETMDALYLTMWATGTNVVYANGASESAVNTIVDYADFNKALRTLRNNKARRTSPKVDPSQKVGTGSVMPGYWVLMSESMLFDVRSAASFSGKFRLVSDYGTGAGVRGEFGALDIGFRILPIPDEAMTAGSCIVAGGGATGGSGIQETSNVADVHYAICIGEQAAGGINLAAANGGLIRKSLGSSGVADALDQRSSIGWKKYDTRLVLDQNFFVTVKAGVSS